MRVAGAGRMSRPVMCSCVTLLPTTLLSTILLSLLSVGGLRAAERVHFTSGVVPILTKLGCNSGGCHGKATGQNGFRLSLLGFDPDRDYQALVQEARGRRISPSSPDHSLLLRKATNRVPHGGGRRLHESTAEYRLLRRWIAQGARGPHSGEPLLSGIEVRPTEGVLRDKRQVPLRVTAHLSDGSSRDVTDQSLFSSNQSEVGAVDSAGLVSAGGTSGLFSVMIRYGGRVATFHGIAPMNHSPDRQRAMVAKLAEIESESIVDQHLVRQWRKLGVVPSQPVGDDGFIRRATLDICGTLPTPQEVQAYRADSRPDKRPRLIDRLLERPEYAQLFALKWADILQNRGAGYSTSKQRAGTTLFAGWLRDQIAANRPYDQFVTQILTASGSQAENPPTVWYRSIRKLPEFVESVSQAFLGVRVQCAQCHHHPFERWSQTDYYGLAAVFSAVGRKGGFADAEVPTEETIFLATAKPVLHPRTRAVVAPRGLGGPVFDVGPFDDPRVHLTRWMTKPENPYFARTMANRMWAHFMGRGLIDPIDDARTTNPASNPQLLDALAAGFVESRFDVKQLIRTICNSLAYRLQSAPNDWNRSDGQTFSRFYARRLSAEVLLDGFSQVLESPTPFSGGPGKFPEGTRAIELPDENVPTNFLTAFGRPARTSACECERVDAPSLAQALELINSAEIQRKLRDKKGYAAKLAGTGTHVENVTDTFLRIFARPPSEREKRVALEFLESEKNRTEAYRSLLWSLLATNEFMFNH